MVAAAERPLIVAGGGVINADDHPGAGHQMGTELDNITEFEELAEHREHAPTSVALLD